MSLDDIIDLHSTNPQAATINGVCKWCDRQTQLVLTASMTCYHWEGEGEDPNAPFYACESCGDEYTQMMNDQWHEYWSSR